MNPLNGEAPDVPASRASRELHPKGYGQKKLYLFSPHGVNAEHNREHPTFEIQEVGYG